MGRDLADGNLAVPRHQPGADLNGGDCKSPSWADAIRPDPLGGRSGIDKDGVPVAALLFLVHDAEHPVDGVCCLRIEDLCLFVILYL